MKSKHEANSEYLATSKEFNPFLCKCPIKKKYFVSVFFSQEHIKKRGFIVVKQKINYYICKSFIKYDAIARTNRNNKHKLPSWGIQLQ